MLKGSQGSSLLFWQGQLWSDWKAKRALDQQRSGQAKGAIQLGSLNEIIRHHQFWSCRFFGYGCVATLSGDHHTKVVTWHSEWQNVTVAIECSKWQGWRSWSWSVSGATCNVSLQWFLKAIGMSTLKLRRQLDIKLQPAKATAFHTFVFILVLLKS